MSLSLPQLSFDNHYARLSERLYTRQHPTPVAAPKLFVFNEILGKTLGLDRAKLGDEVLAAIFSGNEILPGSQPLASAYAGHQFGHFAGTLGDGRAIMLGEISTSRGEHYEVQLKGSGRTPYSRGGDGRAWLGPVIREYLISNAMPRYGVASTQALAAVTTGEQVLREYGPVPGAVLTRVARSHARVGTFEYLAMKKDEDGARELVDHLIEHHYPTLIDAENRSIALLNAVIDKQANLIASWQSIGFIHGVMNTDNASLVGETIDYGPCAFMDEFDRAKVFSSIDRQGRYAYQNQPRIGHWNMAMLAQTLLPLMSSDETRAIALAQSAVDRFPGVYAAAYVHKMKDKFSLIDSDDEHDIELMDEFLEIMQAHSVDFTLAFRALSQTDDEALMGLYEDKTSITDWYTRWQMRVNHSHDAKRMQQINPAVIPRNHWVEATIQSALNGEWDLFNEFDSALSKPFVDNSTFSTAPKIEQRVQATFCGT